MRPKQADVIFQLLESPSAFRFKSALSLQILLLILSKGGLCDLKVLTKISVTPMALRQHVKMLEEADWVKLEVKKTSRRNKLISLTNKANQKLEEYNSSIEGLFLDYAEVLSTDPSSLRK
jgi:DNA-binding MarR family transcriptional regulator